MKIAIMQPTYLPWAGYFHMMSNTDFFIFLDDVQFSKGSWQQRNKILLKDQAKYLTIPVLTGGEKQQLIKDVKTDLTKLWKKKHLLTLQQTYGKHPYFHEIKDLLNHFYQNDTLLLADFTMALTKEIAQLLGIRTNIRKSSELPVSGRKSEYLINVCHYLGAEVYLSARGSKDYIEQEGLFSKSNIKVEYHDYIPGQYTQKHHEGFISHLSIIDVLANLGIHKTREYILEGNN
ncbi:hypothetical protein FAY30_03170 [Bacillus sp. S3]|uniref:WbqC family protein n=1 Tax=Bacillus sp. S3 TaxID=486398 RepID=UPI00118B5F09|nr:WbqC family protein [Bacillus sp. S3]QCJ40989.1 hypothetical protein FAY30_03170 [Bacillus sp. S3]